MLPFVNLSMSMKKVSFCLFCCCCFGDGCFSRGERRGTTVTKQEGGRGEGVLSQSSRLTRRRFV